MLTDVFYTLLVEITIAPLLAFCNPFDCIRGCKRSRLRRNYKNMPISQLRANQIFEGAVLFPADMYAKIIRVLYLTVFFSFFYPGAPIIGLIAFFLHFWIFKFRLLRIAKRPPSIGLGLTRTVIQLCKGLPYVITVCTMTNKKIAAVTADYILRKKLTLTTEFLIIFSFVYLILPLTSWIERLIKSCCCCKKLEEKRLHVSYSSLEPEFETDYDRENPLTKRISLKKLQIELSSKKWAKLKIESLR